jgi:N-acetylglucosaminyldiphosphoundecaprenol N-acetyl-beta-D-mannosaminyltransferase
MAQVVDTLEAMIRSGARHQCITVAVWQTYLAVFDPRFKKAVDGADMVLCDGFPLLLASKLGRTSLPEIVAGVDSVPRFCKRAAERGFSVFVIGGVPSVLEKAGDRLRESCGAFRFGYYCPPVREEFTREDSEKMVGAANAFEPDLVYAAMGTPKGEVWLNEHFEELNAKITMGVGGAFDAIAGDTPRPPGWARRFGLEGVIRTLQNPGPRMARNWASVREFPRLVIRDLRAQQKDGGATA